MGKYISSTCAVLVIISQLAAPFALAQELPTGGGSTSGDAQLFETVPANNTQRTTTGGSGTQTTTVTLPTGAGTQAAASQGTTGQNNAQTGSVEGLAADAVGCSVGQILGGIAKAGISAVIGSIKGVVSSQTGSVTKQAVPITNQTMEDADRALQSKEVSPGTTDFAGAISSLLDGVSFDSIGFCLANATIQYITQSTINWINSGFEGNPTFVDNPGKFFQDIADMELTGFIEEMGLGFMCSGVSPKVRIAIVNDYANKSGGKAFNDKHKCSFDKLGTTVDAFVNDFRNGGINAFVEFVYNPASRPSSAYLAAQEELTRRTRQKTGTAQFELRASDFLSFKKCREVSDVKTRKIKQVDCETYTPGRMIEEQANNAINSPRNRLEIADEFDEVVAALVNQLIKAALSEMTSTDSPDNDDDNDEEVEIEDTVTISIPSSGGNTGYVPAPPRNVSGVCRVSTTTVMVDEPVQFTVIPQGGNNRYIYDWLGSSKLPTSTLSSSIVVSFATTTNASDIDVRIRSLNRTALVQCPAVTVTSPLPLDVSCAPDDTTASLGQSVTWESTVSGGTGLYTYEWSGDISSYAKNSQDNTVVYNSRGTYDAALRVTSGSQSMQVSCEDTVRAR